jgi:hypothetical protein
MPARVDAPASTQSPVDAGVQPSNTEELKMNKLRGSNIQNHQKPYRDNLKLTDVPTGPGPFRGKCSMDVLDMDTMAAAEGSSARFPASDNSKMQRRDNGE